ncbi:MAG: efflux RND transporter periplasmic adaptor subunit, partial [Geminicoccaceae bacterium]
MALGAIGGWYLFAEPASSARETAGPRSRTVPVEAGLAETGHAATLVRATGTLIASDAVVVQPEISGRVTAVLFEQGQAVRADDPLIKLDPTAHEAELAKAEAALALARENYNRSESLSRRGATAARALDEARAALRTAEAEVTLVRHRLSDTDIRAPFDGVVGLKQLSVGRYVEPGDELVALERIDPLYLDFRLSERWLAKLVPGDKVAVAVDALPGESFTGTITALDPKVDVNGRAVQLRATVPNPDRSLRPGLFARVA